MPDPTLKPCPRCGGEAKIMVGPPTHYLAAASFAVECKACNLIGTYSPTRALAVAWWNERKAAPEPEPTHAAVEVPSTPHECPYESRSIVGGGNVCREVACGDRSGWLCDRCLADAASANACQIAGAIDQLGQNLHMLFRP